MIAVVGCGSKNEEPRSGSGGSAKPLDPRSVPTELRAARAGFQTKLVDAPGDRTPPPTPPAKTFRLVKYPAAPGKLAAYLTPDPTDGKRHPAIIWITGGDCNSIDDVWSARDPANDQSARQYREAGIVMMFPSLRGGNDNPGRKEGFLSEVDDVMAAHAYLKEQPYVDPKQIYLGGHSTGGTLVLLVAAYARDDFRAVFAFGPVDDVKSYGIPNPYCPFDMTNPKELELRSPARWIDGVVTPTFLFEGVDGNIDSLHAIAKATRNPFVKTFASAGGHFDLLAPVNKFLAGQIIGRWKTGDVDLTRQDLERGLE